MKPCEIKRKLNDGTGSDMAVEEELHEPIYDHVYARLWQQIADVVSYPVRDEVWNKMYHEKS